jgi:uncharacterized damage-inducible protein DinB
VTDELTIRRVTSTPEDIEMLVQMRYAMQVELNEGQSGVDPADIIEETREYFTKQLSGFHFAAFFVQYGKEIVATGGVVAYDNPQRNGGLHHEHVHRPGLARARPGEEGAGQAGRACARGGGGPRLAAGQRQGPTRVRTLGLQCVPGVHGVPHSERLEGGEEMSKLEIIRHLYDYNEYANGRLMEIAGELDETELKGAQGASYESILGNLAHLAAAQVNWLERWRTGANRVSGDVMIQGWPSLADVRPAFDTSHAGLREFIAALSDERVEAPLAFKDSSGASAVRPLWQQMLHVANHGTYHRGEIAMALSALGHSPGDLDFLYWEYGRGG